MIWCNNHRHHFDNHHCMPCTIQFNIDLLLLTVSLSQAVQWLTSQSGNIPPFGFLIVTVFNLMLQPLWRRRVVRRPSSRLSTTSTTNSWGGRANVNRISYAILRWYFINSWGNIFANIFEIFLFSQGCVESARSRSMALLLGGGSISASTTTSSTRSLSLAGNTYIIKFDFNIILFEFTGRTVCSAVGAGKRWPWTSRCWGTSCLVVDARRCQSYILLL